MYDKIRNDESAEILSEIASDAGAIMLANGAEIYRVEDTIERIIRSKKNIRDVDVYSTFNVIILSFSYKDEIHSNVRRVKGRSNNLYYVDKVNSFSRRFVAGELSLNEALVELKKIKEDTGKPLGYMILGAGLAASAYSLLIGGRWEEFIISLFVGMLAYFAAYKVEQQGIGYFVVNFIYGIVVSLLTLLASLILEDLMQARVIVASMMAFLPGMMLTNAMRDLMSGDSTSGLTGAVIAILISTALAMGVGLPLLVIKFWG